MGRVDRRAVRAGDTPAQSPTSGSFPHGSRAHFERMLSGHDARLSRAMRDRGGKERATKIFRTTLISVSAPLSCVIAKCATNI
jgi:hypothetical protein